MNTPHQSSLGREVAYPSGYDPSLLFPIPRAGARAELGLAAGAALPFTGHDRWHAYELGWLDPRGKPQVAGGAAKQHGRRSLGGRRCRAWYCYIITFLKLSD